MPTTYVIQQGSNGIGLGSPPVVLGQLVVEDTPQLLVTRVVVFYPADGSAGVETEKSFVF